MTKRPEDFTRKVMLAAWVRCKGRCEICGVVLVPGKFRNDHRIPCALGGLGTLENCVVQCVACDKPKTSADVSRIRKADRQRAAHIGAKPAPHVKIKSAGFAKPDKPDRVAKQMPLRRHMFIDK